MKMIMEGSFWRAGLVDICLISEVPFVLRGEDGLLSYVQHLLDVQGHAVICVAEGAGQVRMQDAGCVFQRIRSLLCNCLAHIRASKINPALAAFT